VQSLVPRSHRYRLPLLAGALLAVRVFAPGNAAATETWFSGPGGGVVHALAVDAGDKRTLYAGTEVRGVFKSTDGGVSWAPANPLGPRHVAVYALATTSAALYAGTRGDGVFRSEDAAAHWGTATIGLGSLDVNALATATAMPHTLYAGTKTGVFKSTDDALHWRSTGDLAEVEVNALAIDLATPATVYAGTQGAGVFKTTDGGAHWLAEDNAPRYVNALAIDPTTPSTVFAAASDALGGIFKSTDGGASWAPASRGIAYSNGTTPVSGLALLIDPSNANTLWAGTYTAGVFKTTDGAKNWEPLGGSPDVAYAMVNDPVAPQSLYAAGYGVFKATDGGASWSTTGLPSVAYVNALAVDHSHPTTLYLATNGEGVFKSTDAAGTWRRASDGLTTPYLNDILIDVATSPRLYVSTEAGVFTSTDAGESWDETNLRAPTRGLAVAATAPPTVYASSFDAAIGGAVFRSTDAGESWEPSATGPMPLGRVVIDPQDARTLYVGSQHSYAVNNGGLWKSSDGGAHWMATGLKSFDFVYALAVDPQSSAVVYAGYSAGLLKSTDGGAVWRAVNAGLPEGGVGAIVFDPLDPRLMYALAGNVFTSTDAAASWSQIGSGLDDTSLALAIDPVTGTTLYAGTASGVFVLQRTDLNPTRTAPAAPTPTPTVDSRCAPDQITLAPSAAPPGSRVMLSGQCYFLHSGRQAAVYFDATLVGEVTGDTLGNYTLEFTVPADALPGSHLVRVVGAQSARFDVQPLGGTPTPTPTIPLGTFCPAENMTVVPNAGAPGTRVVVSGQCDFIHSGAQGAIYFDDTPLETVHGDTPGNYAGGFIVPSEAAPGPHTVRLVAYGQTAQLATFAVEAAQPTFTPTPTATPTPLICDGVEIPAPILDFTFTIAPPEPRVGDDVTVTVRIRNLTGGFVGQPRAGLVSSTSVLSPNNVSAQLRSTLLYDETVSFQTRAVQAGATELRVYVAYEARFGCSGSDFTPGQQNSPPVVLQIGSAQPSSCVGDCSGVGEVSVADVLTMVNIALGSRPVSDCSAGDHDHNGEVSIDEIVKAVGNALVGC
jgi:photosystem II stability/assembly factor-like uncharacterized protein